MKGLSVSCGEKGREWARRTVHKDRLCDVVGIVAGYDVVYTERSSTAVQRLPPEDPAKRAVVLLSDRRDDPVHRPSVQLVVGEDLERHVVLLLIAFDGLWEIVRLVDT